MGAGARPEGAVERLSVAQSSSEVEWRGVRPEGAVEL